MKNIFSVLILFVISLFGNLSYRIDDDEDFKLVDDPEDIEGKDRNSSELERREKEETYIDKHVKKGSVYEAYGIPKTSNKAVSETENDGEKAEADKSAEKTEDSETKTYRINKEELTRDQILAQATDHFGIELSKLPEDVQQKQIDAFVSLQNKKAADASLTYRNQELAKSKQEYEAEREQFLAEKESEFKRIQAENKKLAVREAELKAKAEIDLTTIYDEDEKEKAREEKADAKADLRDIRKEKQSLKSEAEAVESEMIEDNLKFMVVSLQRQYPELVTSRRVNEILDDYEADRVVDMEEVQRAEAIREIIGDYIETYQNSDTRPKIENFYIAKRFKYNVPPAKSNGTVPKKTTLAEEKTKIEADKKAQQIAEQKKAPIEVERRAGDFSTGKSTDLKTRVRGMGY